jgi:hypothetical protein
MPKGSYANRPARQPGRKSSPTGGPKRDFGRKKSRPVEGENHRSSPPRYRRP